MIEKMKQFKEIEKTEFIPFEEIVALDLNLSGVAVNEHYKRVRFNLLLNNKQHLLFSLENNKLSLYNIQQNKLYFKDIFLFDVSELVEDLCKIFYTRKNEKVLCFNPNSRSLCNGCRFCYQTTSYDERQISSSMLLSTFEEWLQKNNLIDLSHLEQVAVVTGCFKSEQMVVDYLFKLKEILSALNFQNELLYLGIISDFKNIGLLSKIKPLQLCFTIECFENREKILLKNKNLDVAYLKALMKKSIELGIKTTFSYILGLDSLPSIQEKMFLLKGFVTAFPIVSLFQTDDIRLKYRHTDANDLCYYLRGRKIIESIFADTALIPNSWNNCRSLWRTCYRRSNEDILLK
jgi:hypothetical protein